MAFGWFKKEKLKYDPTDIRITDLQIGFVLEYDLKNWEVKREFKYDWGDNFFTKEFQIKSSDEDLYIHLEDDDELEINISRKINVQVLYDDLSGYIQTNEKPPTKLSYNDKTFFRQSENPGYFQEAGKSDWQEFISWDYRDETNKHTLTIEQWDDDKFEASAGKVVEEYEFSSILPAEK